MSYVPQVNIQLSFFLITYNHQFLTVKSEEIFNEMMNLLFDLMCKN